MISFRAEELFGMLGGVGRILAAFRPVQVEGREMAFIQHRINCCTQLSLYVSTRVSRCLAGYAGFWMSPHSLAFATFVSCTCSSVHCRMASTSLTMTSRSMPARKQTLTLSSPAGTVGGTTGLTMKPFSRRKVERACGVDVRRPMIGAGGFESR